MNFCDTGQEICIPDSTKPRVVIIGGGFAGISLAKELRNSEVQTVLIDKNNYHQFIPLLYQVATSGIEPDSIVFPLRKLFGSYSNTVFRMAEVIRIDPDQQLVFTSIGQVNYDFLVLATGSDTNFFGLDEIANKSIGMKFILEALDLRSLILQNLEESVTSCDNLQRDALSNFVIAGGGPAGVETAGALAEFREYILTKDYPELQKDIMKIFLIEAGDRLLNTMSSESSEYALRKLEQMSVDVQLNTNVNSFDGDKVVTNNGTIIAKTLIWTAGVKGNMPEGIGKDNIVKGNRLSVNRYNQLTTNDRIFAIGDIACMVSETYPHGHPMVAQAALQQGKHLAKNIKAIVDGKTMKSFTYSDKGSLATIGRNKAVAELPGAKFKGFMAWLVWSLVHLTSISGFKNKLLVGIEWSWSYLFYDRGSRLIIHKYKKKTPTDITDKFLQET